MKIDEEDYYDFLLDCRLRMSQVRHGHATSTMLVARERYEEIYTMIRLHLGEVVDFQYPPHFRFMGLTFIPYPDHKCPTLLLTDVAEHTARMQGAVRSKPKSNMKTYNLLQTVKAIQARELKRMWVNPDEQIPEEFRLMAQDGRLKFYSKSIKISGHVVDPDDYICITEDHEIVPVSEKYFNERFILEE